MDEFKIRAYRFTPPTGSLKVHNIFTISNRGLNVLLFASVKQDTPNCQQLSENIYYSLFTNNHTLRMNVVLDAVAIENRVFHNNIIYVANCV